MDYFIDLVIVGISIGMVYGLVALGISFIYSGLDIVHFAHGEIYMIGAFLGVTALHLTGLNYPALILVAMLLTGLIGVVIERVFYRRLTSQGGGISFAGMGIIIAGFGISMILQNVAFLIWTARAVPFPVNFGLPLEIGDLMLPRSYLWIVGVTIALMLSRFEHFGAPKYLSLLEPTPEGRHYNEFGAGGAAVILGGGWAGSSSFNLFSNRLSSGSGSV